MEQLERIKKDQYSFYSDEWDIEITVTNCDNYAESKRRLNKFIEDLKGYEHG